MKKKTGMIRKVDELGRVVIPSEIRKIFDFVEKSPVELSVHGTDLILEIPKINENAEGIGLIKLFDELGRITIPIEIRNKLGFEVKSEIEILIEGRSIILRKYLTSCVFCGKEKNFIEFKSKKVCNTCLRKLKEY